MGYPQILLFFRILCGQPIFKFPHKWVKSQGCGTQRYCYPLVFLNFYITLEAIMITVFKINCGLLSVGSEGAYSNQLIL